MQHFPEVVDIDFTAKMEKELDEVAEGKDTWQKTCKDFWTPFSKDLEKKYREVKKSDLVKETDKTCPKCGAPLVERLGKFGKFYACSKFPECKYTESLEEFTQALGVTKDNFVRMHQVHSNTVYFVSEKDREQTIDKTDGLITDTTNIFLRV